MIQESWSQLNNEGRDGDLVVCLEGQRGGGKLTLQCQSSFSLLPQLLCELLHLPKQSFLTLPKGLLTLRTTERRFLECYVAKRDKKRVERRNTPNLLQLMLKSLQERMGRGRNEENVNKVLK